SYKIQRGIHVHLIQFFMCPEFWVHINCAAVILRRFLFQGAVARPELGTAERGTLLFKSGLE
ncbi:hypothetical protein, partial [Intestinimonas sp. RTP31139st1_F5_RTP31139_211217]|uniref:hypothetical protein n=1 Tax=Intestinimonas sp. RTP31139st1_F5_RTP31139_211217 TaxID=3143190 RepID=UPI0032EE3ADC